MLTAVESASEREGLTDRDRPRPGGATTNLDSTGCGLGISPFQDSISLAHDSIGMRQTVVQLWVLARGEEEIIAFR